MIGLKITVSLEKTEAATIAENLTNAARLAVELGSFPSHLLGTSMPPVRHTAGTIPAVQTASNSETASLTILLTGDEKLRQLNRQFLGIDAPTDVLSFPAGETDPDTGEYYLGDVVISFPRAQAQAQERGHSTAEELDLLVVHGVLHLLGYDHADAEERDRMWAVQQQVLNQLGREIKLADEPIF
jgi:probable rRNA maturation factor